MSDTILLAIQSIVQQNAKTTSEVVSVLRQAVENSNRLTAHLIERDKVANNEFLRVTTGFAATPADLPDPRSTNGPVDAKFDPTENFLSGGVE